MSGDEIDLSGLVDSMEKALETAFPGWRIRREESGRWSARRPKWGALYADSAPELRELLSRFAVEDGA